MQKRLYNTGLACIFLYCVIYSLSQVVVGHYERTISAYLLATCVFFITSLFYSIVISRNYRNTIKLVSANLGAVAKINITTALAWLTIIYALKYLEPAVALSISFGVLPIATMLASLLNKEVTKPSAIDFFLAIILFILIVILCIHLVQKDLITHQLPLGGLIYGISLCVISGAANAYNAIYAKVLSQHKFSVTQVLAVRFYLAFITAFAILLVTHSSLTPVPQEIGPILLVAFASTIVPIYFIQLGITFSNAIAVALITPILPALTFFLELLDPKIKFSLEIFILSILISITILFAAYYKFRRQTNQ